MKTRPLLEMTHSSNYSRRSPIPPVDVPELDILISVIMLEKRSRATIIERMKVRLLSMLNPLVESDLFCEVSHRAKSPI